MEFLAKIKSSDWLHFIGALLIALSILCALSSNYYNGVVMGEAGLGMAVLGSAPDTEEYKEKARLRNLSDRYFRFGIIFALGGLLAQVYGLVCAVAER